MKRFLTRFLLALAAGLLGPTVSQATPLSTAFSYQGQLTENGSPLNGSADLRYTLYDVDVSGSTVGGPVTVSDVNVVDGLFVVELNFGVD
ncbi:MAG: hypothetical protein V3T70_00455, partial [Phycisphaerae bacterium]